MTRAPQFGITRAPVGSAANQPATAHQRLYARTLMDQRDLSTIWINDRHHKYFRLAGLEPRGIGRRVDAVLEELTRAEIVRLCDTLRRVETATAAGGAA